LSVSTIAKDEVHFRMASARSLNVAYDEVWDQEL
jgi:hypothetical protein